MEQYCEQCGVDLDIVDDIQIYTKNEQEQTVCWDCHQHFEQDFAEHGWETA